MADPIPVKTIVFGDAGVGKTAFVFKASKDEFPEEYRSTVGIDFLEKVMQVAAYAPEPAGTEVDFRSQAWDTAGQERYRFLVEAYARDSAIVFMTYDITKSETLNKNFLSIIEKEKPLVTVLVGFKADLTDSRQVTTEDGQKFADDNGFDLFFEVSNKDGTSALDAYKKSLQRLLEKVADGEVEYRTLSDAPGVVEARKRKEEASRPAAAYTQGPYLIVSMKSKLPLSFGKDAKAEGDTLAQASLDFGKAQEFNLVPTRGQDPTEFYIENANSGLVLQVDAEGAAVKQAALTGAANQKFKLGPGGASSFRIFTTLEGTLLCLDASSATENGTIVAKKDARQEGAQYWKDYCQQRFRFLGANAPQSKM